jgi:hypothetical protein
VDKDQRRSRRPGETVTHDDYAREVDWELRDLPWSQRRNLVAEIRDHLAELPPDTDLVARLGTPPAYATELRAAAGLPRRRGVVAFLRARRPRDLAITVVSVVAAGLAISALAWINSYQPLGLGNLSQYPDRSVEEPGGNSSSVVVRQGQPFQLAIEIRNNGRYSVRILAVPVGRFRPFRARVLMYPPTPLGGSSARPRPFRPFTLEPGHFDILVLRGVYSRCGYWRGSDGSTSLSDFPVRYQFLWRTATASIPLPEELVFVYKKNISCR